MQRLTLLGSTGSIGQQTLDLVARHPQHYCVTALTAYSDSTSLFKQCLQFQPEYAVLVDAQAAQQLRQTLAQQGLRTQVLSGPQALLEVASLAEVDCVVAGIVGAAGLMPTLAAVQAHKRVLLANKEPLVMAGDLFMQALQQSDALLLPLDSEHNAIFQCMPADVKIGQAHSAVSKLTLTASGGALRDMPLTQLAQATPAQACAHPNWSMGAKITVDSATLMNKGFEVIEAHYLFAMSAEQIDVLIHPQSKVHALVHYHDGSVLAHLGQPDMRIPIAHALAWPKRVTSGADPLDMLALQELQFLPVDERRYPCFQLALHALTQGGNATTVLNAANEIAVQAFLAERVAFDQIYSLVDQAMQHFFDASNLTELNNVLALDQQVREFVQAKL